MKKVISMILIALLIVTSGGYALAANPYKENIAIGAQDNNYTAKIWTYSKQNHMVCDDFWEGYKLDDYMIAGGDCSYKQLWVSDDIKWSNPNYTIILGIQNVDLTLTLKDKTEIPLTMKIEGKEAQVKKWNFNQVEEVTGDAITLTADTVVLSDSTTYDININNKKDGSTYLWSTSDEKVAKVNQKNGLVTAVNDGKATITCKITEETGNVTELKSTVIVGEDENFPSLSDTDLDLEVGDSYTLKADNKPKGSICKWKTSDKSVAKVTTKLGKVTAVKKGDAVITCTVTHDKEVTVLRCDVTVE